MLVLCIFHTGEHTPHAVDERSPPVFHSISTNRTNKSVHDEFKVTTTDGRKIEEADWPSVRLLPSSAVYMGS